MDNFWRSQEWLEYLLNSKHGMVYSDRSFFLNNKFIPLVQEGEEFYSPGFDDDKKILQVIKELAQQYRIKRIQVNSQIKSYLNISGYTCILDLDNIKLSKGHKSCIKKAEKYLTYEIVNETKQFMQDYLRIADKATRPERTFEILQNWIGSGIGTLLKADYQGNTVGYIYILHYDGWSYYFMGCTVPEYKDYNVSHFLIWKAISILKNMGIKYLEMGGIVTNSLHHIPSEKEINISKFKKGFGGNIIIKPVSEYYFSRDFFKETMTKRIDSYIENEYIQKNV